MSDEHKEALNVGRNQGRVVRSYLEGLEVTKPKRGRKRTKETVMKRIAQIDQAVDRATPIRKLDLIQERIDLVEELEKFEQSVDIDSLEDAFVDVAKEYAERRGISYAAFREWGIDAAVLKRAGVRRAIHK